jgi:hypothetical protein
VWPDGPPGTLPDEPPGPVPEPPVLPGMPPPVLLPWPPPGAVVPPGLAGPGLAAPGDPGAGGTPMPLSAPTQIGPVEQPAPASNTRTASTAKHARQP